MYERVKGYKYEAGLDVVEIAKRMRNWKSCGR